MAVRLILIIIFTGIHSVSMAQQQITVEEYVEIYKELAVEEMQRHLIPASITLAQGILESNCGNSPLAREANNHFGIKCHKEWTGKTFHQDDDEKDECFRKYAKAEDSYRDHSEFLATRDRYKLLFDLEITDYKGWAYGLKQAGYATNPRYPELLIKIIEENGLDEYDQVGSSQFAAGNSQPAVKTQNSKLPTGPPESYELAGRSESGRNIFINNGVKFIYARVGDDCQAIAADFGIYTWQIYKYNDLSRDVEIVPGQKIYLERKKKRSAYDFHTVREGETLYDISAIYGIRLKVLSDINDINPFEKISEGTILKLN